MKPQFSLAATAALIFLVSVSPVLAAVPTVNTFTLAATAVSPVPVTAFTASDSDGTVVGYMITTTTTKPSASDTRWTSTPWTQLTSTSIGAITLYAWAKDNANSVSNSKSATTNVVGGHVHSMNQVTGLTMALAGKADVNHSHEKYANVVVVAKSGGDFIDLSSAMLSIADASAMNPYLIKIMPGVYETGSIGMKPYVDVEGSGENITKLSASDLLAPASNTELRDITVERVGSCSGACYAILMDDANQINLSRVTAIAGDSEGNLASAIRGGGTLHLKGVTAMALANGSNPNVAIIINGDGAILDDVTAIAENGVYNRGILLDGNVVLKNVTVSVSKSSQPSNSLGIQSWGTNPSVTMEGVNLTSDGVGIEFMYYGTLKINYYSNVSGSLYSISFPSINPASAFLGYTQLDGPINKSVSSIKCVGVFDSNYDPVICP